MKSRLSHKKRRGARLGQHFLTGTWAARKLVEAANIGAGDTVLEIGPGKRALTREIVATGANVIAVEKDTSLASTPLSGCTKSRQGNVRIIEADIRDVTPQTLGLKRGEYIVAANIPYYITGEIIRKFLTTQQQPKTMALLVQKEVAERIVARNLKESILSLSVKCYGVPSIAARVSRGNFTPRPSVDSAILVIRNISRNFFDTIKEEKFFDVVKTGFASKRKKMSGNLGKKFGRAHVDQILEKLGVSTNARAEDVHLETWKNITRAL